jgi:glycosyltransferase involved in cell wall biosynthesis
MRTWVLVTGDVTPWGGMDCANHALAAYLGRQEGTEVHLVTHRAADDLLALPSMRLHLVPRPRGSHLLGMPLLARTGRRWARRLAAERGARVIVNGGNCPWDDINWVHYVHAAWAPRAAASLVRRAKAGVLHRYDRAAERSIVPRARIVIANSERTRADVIERLGVPPERVRTVYYGTDSERFRPIGAAERAEARARLGWTDERPAVAFVGALGDRRKGFDTLFAAWRALADEQGWDARLVVVGAGAELDAWRARARAAGLGDSVVFLGFRDDVPTILAACDLLVSPTRYEAYGLNVHEALCRGLPALVSASAGVAERVPAGLRERLLLDDPEDAAALASRLRAWHCAPEAYRAAVAPLGQALRARTWDHCAAEIVALAEGAAPVESTAVPRDWSAVGVSEVEAHR